MGVAASAWCVICGADPEATITSERRGVLMHYGTCMAHVHQVAERMQRDLDRIDREDRARALASQGMWASPGDEQEVLELQVRSFPPSGQV